MRQSAGIAVALSRGLQAVLDILRSLLGVIVEVMGSSDQYSSMQKSLVAEMIVLLTLGMSLTRKDNVHVQQYYALLTYTRYGQKYGE